MPIAKERMGGTEGEVENREEARRMVPSPPKVAARSVFWVRRLGDSLVDVVWWAADTGGVEGIGAMVTEVGRALVRAWTCEASVRRDRFG